MPTEQPSNTNQTAIEVENADSSSLKVILNDCVKAIRKLLPSRELSVAATKIQEARMWIEEHQMNG